MPQTSRRSLAPATLALLLSVLPFLSASAMLALKLGLRWGGMLLTFAEFTGPFMFLLFFVGSGALFFAATRTRLTDWRLIVSALCLVGTLVNFLLYSR
jgi:hypothetical protein